MNLVKVPNTVGQYQDPETGRVINVSRVREDVIIDSVGLPSGTITANTKRNFFEGITGVLGRQHFFNFSGRNKLPSQTALLQLTRMGLYLQQAMGNITTNTDDACKLYCNSHLFVQLDASDVLYDGPGIANQVGLGVWGASGDTDSPLATLGNPSLSAAPERLAEAQWAITQENTLTGFVEWQNATWFNDANHAGTGIYVAPIISAAAGISLVMRGPLATA